MKFNKSCEPRLPLFLSDEKRKGGPQPASLPLPEAYLLNFNLFSKITPLKLLSISNNRLDYHPEVSLGLFRESSIKPLPVLSPPPPELSSEFNLSPAEKKWSDVRRGTIEQQD